MLEPLGQSQVLAYLKVLSKKNKIFILSFEKKDDFQNNELREQINNEINNL